MWNSLTKSDRIVAVITSEEKRWIETLLTEEYRITPGLRSSLRAAASTFAAFLLCGAVSPC
jgi:hypothetical protein